MKDAKDSYEGEARRHLDSARFEGNLDPLRAGENAELTFVRDPGGYLYSFHSGKDGVTVRFSEPGETGRLISIWVPSYMLGTLQRAILAARAAE